MAIGSLGEALPENDSSRQSFARSWIFAQTDFQLLTKRKAIPKSCTPSRRAPISFGSSKGYRPPC
mgnify:CR=1 FL=1